LLPDRDSKPKSRLFKKESPMSISATTNYMSSETIEAWMEQKTEGLYGQMGDAMDVSNRRAAAEQEMTHIKGMLADAKNNSGDVTAVNEEINNALDEYKDVPELVQTLGAVSQGLSLARDSTAAPSKDTGGYIEASPASSVIKASSGQIDDWTKTIGDTVDGLGKQDQLGLINIQEFNSQINQAKQIASALMDASDKAANAIISHIS
jgi:hypothetical protein